MTNIFSHSGLLGNSLQDAQIAAIFSAPAFAARMLAFELAWTDALEANGVVDGSAAQSARTALEHLVIDIDLMAAGSDRDGLPVPTLVKSLREDLTPDGRAAIHTGATSQDVIDTAMVLTLLDVLDIAEARLARVLDQLDDLAAHHGLTHMMGRTRMQAALPITVADRIGSWRRPLTAHAEAVEAVRETLARIQCGGAVGLRDQPEGCAQQVADHVAAALGLASAPVWHSDRSVFIDFGNWLLKLTGTLGKMGQDLALMAQQGVDELLLDGAGGSSAMPHKQNPVRAELMVALARYVAGQQGILGQAMIHEQERSGAAWAIEWLTLPAMCEATGASLANGEALLGQIRRLGRES